MLTNIQRMAIIVCVSARCLYCLEKHPSIIVHGVLVECICSKCIRCVHAVFVWVQCRCSCSFDGGPHALIVRALAKVDPTRTCTSGKVEIGAFRCYPDVSIIYCFWIQEEHIVLTYWMHNDARCRLTRSRRVKVLSNVSLSTGPSQDVLSLERFWSVLHVCCMTV